MKHCVRTADYNLKALAADVLNIKPVMGSDPDGNIVQLDKARGMKKALDKMVTQMFKNAGNTEERYLQFHIATVRSGQNG